MSQPPKQPEPTMETLRADIQNLHQVVMELRGFIETEFGRTAATLEGIREIAIAARDAAEDKAQEEEEEEVPTTPETRRKEKEEQTPRPTTSLGEGSKPSLFSYGGAPRTPFFPPPATSGTGILGPALGITGDPPKPRSSLRFNSRSRESSPERGRAATTPAPVERKKKYKVEAPAKLKSTVPKDVKKWLMNATVWVQRYKDEFETEQEVISHLFTFLDGELGDWAFPFQEKLLSERPGRRAPIRTLEQFAEGLLATFGDPDAERAAVRKIVELNQTGTTVEYTTKFRNLAADLEWNEAALMGQYSRGLHWKVREILSQQETQPTTLQGLINVAQRIDAVRRENEESRPKKEKGKEKEKGKTTSQGSGTTTKEKVVDKENFVDREERDRRRKEGLCIKCGESGHNIKECPNSWRKSKLRKEEKKETKKESAKVAQDKPEEIEFEAESGKE